MISCRGRGGEGGKNDSVRVDTGVCEEGEGDGDGDQSNEARLTINHYRIQGTTRTEQQSGHNDLRGNIWLANDHVRYLQDPCQGY